MPKFIGLSVFSGAFLLVGVTHSFCEGALATGRNNAGKWFGVAANHNTVLDARNAAMGQCTQRGSGCSVVFTFRGTCIAVAFGKLSDGRTGYEWSTRPSLGDAQAAVMSNCQGRGGSCELKYSSCDTIDEAAIAAQQRYAAEQAAEAARQQRAAAEAAAQQAIAEASQRRQAEEQAANEARQRRLSEEAAAAQAAAERRKIEEGAADQARQRQAEAAAQRAIDLAAQRQKEEAAAEQARQRRIEAEAAAQRAIDLAIQRQKEDAAAAELADKKRRAAEDANKHAQEPPSIPTPIRPPNDPVHPTINYILIGIIAGLLLAIATMNKWGMALPHKVAIGVISSVAIGLILFFSGFTNEWTLISIPMFGGLIISLIWEKIHA